MGEGDNFRMIKYASNMLFKQILESRRDGSGN
jgi:hypothetical protein